MTLLLPYKVVSAFATITKFLFIYFVFKAAQIFL